jgi:hypothetical protein
MSVALTLPRKADRPFQMADEPPFRVIRLTGLTKTSTIITYVKSLYLR